MARKFIDGFESGGDDLWDSEDNATVVATAGLDMDGSYCLDLIAIDEFLQRSFTADSEMYFAFLYRPINISAKGILALDYNSTAIATVRRNTTSGLVEIYSPTYALADTGSHALSINTTYLIEVRFLMADAGGRFVIKVDGVTDIDYTGDTKPGADTQINSARLGYLGVGLSSYAYFDNFIMDDAAWIGDTKIQAVVPTGAGNSTNWTPSAGANWACVDEKPASDADYVNLNVIDTVDTYAAGNMAGLVGTVKCVQVQSRAKTEGSPTPTNLKLVVRCAAADYFSADKPVPTTAKSLWSLWDVDPSDYAAWTEADVNAMEIGVKSAA